MFVINLIIFLYFSVKFLETYKLNYDCNYRYYYDKIILAVGAILALIAGSSFSLILLLVIFLYFFKDSIHLKIYEKFILK